MKTPEPYQKRCYETLGKTKRGIVECPAGGGKTLIAAWALEKVLCAKDRPRKVKVLWLAGTIDLLNQGRNAVNECPKIEERAEVFYRCPTGVKAGDIAGVSLVIVDECHQSAANSWRAVIEQIPVRWGLSATPDRDGVFDLVGPIVARVTREEVMEKRLCPARVVWHDVDVPSFVGPIDAEAEPVFLAMWDKMPKWKKTTDTKKELMSRSKWQVLVKLAIEECSTRNNMIVGLAEEAARNDESTLILCRTRDHCERLAEEAGGVVFHAKLGKKKRVETLEQMRAGELRTICATSIADQGLDVPSLTTLIMAEPARSFRLAVQRTGRVLRAHPGKDYGTIHDFTGSEHYMLAAQAKARRRIYLELGYLEG